MKTLITGATGFIGSAVVRKVLGRGREVRVLVEPGASRRNLVGLEVEMVEGAIQDRSAVVRAMAGCDVVYHLAAMYQLWLPDPRVMYDVNVEGTKTLLFAALRAGVRRFVHTSSIAAVGLPREGELADETTAFDYWDEANDYIRSKWLSELDALRFAREGLPVVIVNPAFPFGERDAAPTPTGKFIVEALARRVPGYTDGGFNAVDVDDVAECHVLAEERGRVGERYIAGGHNITYKEFYAAVTELAGLPPIERRLPRPLVEGIAWASERWADVSQKAPRITLKAARYAMRKVWFDCAKARRELGMPLTPLRETIARSIEWFRAAGYG
jgi:dihydroflavonol-4-reductase